MALLEDGGLLLPYLDSAFLLTPDPQVLRPHVCRLAGRELTREEWARYAPSQPYRQICP